jgi:hypothetical protein
MTHLEAVDEPRASLDIALADADANVHLRVDKGLQGRNVGVSQGIEKRGPVPREMTNGGDIRALADDPEENWLRQTKAAEWRKGVPLITKYRRK